MIRVLVMIAVAGFLVSVVTLSTAVAIGGPELITDGVWNRWADFGWNWDDADWSDHGRHRRPRRRGPQTTRDLAWTGGDTLDVDVPADVTLHPGARRREADHHRPAARARRPRGRGRPHALRPSRAATGAT